MQVQSKQSDQKVLGLFSYLYFSQFQDHLSPESLIKLLKFKALENGDLRLTSTCVKVMHSQSSISSHVTSSTAQVTSCFKASDGWERGVWIRGGDKVTQRLESIPGD